ncbi:MAG: hypothetical protein WHT29_02110 [Bacteroidales bacterium]
MRADGEGGILFYIILGLVGLVVSYLQNKAKPKQPTTTTNIPEEPRDIWKELMDWDEIKEYPPEEPEIVKQEPIKSQVKESSIEGPVIMDAVHEGTSVFSAQPMSVESAYRITEHPEAINENFIKDTEITDISEEHRGVELAAFNLREAVIYSEILNRKY